MPIQQMLLGGSKIPIDSYSVVFDGNDNLKLTGSGGDHTSFNLGSSDFTIEAWVKRTSDPHAYSRICHFGPYWNDNDAVGMNFDDGDHQNKVTFAAYKLRNQGNVPWNGRILVSSSSVVSNVWYHIAVTRDSNTFRLFIDGTLEDTETSSESLQTNSQHEFAIAGTVDRMVSEPFAGKISNFRYIRGTALYTSGFTVPTEPLTTTSQGATASEVMLLCCKGSTVTSSDVTPDTLGTAGDPTVDSTDHPFA